MKARNHAIQSIFSTQLTKRCTCLYNHGSPLEPDTECRRELHRTNRRYQEAFKRQIPTTHVQRATLTCITRLNETRHSSHLQYEKNVSEKKKAPDFHQGLSILWRRRWESNPRYRFKPICFLSREVPSTTRPRLHVFNDVTNTPQKGPAS
jgi:hypothetical protein